MNQPTLFKPPPADGALTPRQQLAHDLLANHPDGLTATQVGWHIHSWTGCPYCRWNPEQRPCRYAADTGKEVLTALRKRGLVVRRRTGRWQLTHPTVTGSQTDTFPDGF